MKEYLKYEPSDQNAKKRLMWLDFKLGNNKSALSVANQFLKDDPESIRLNTIVGDYYFEQGLYDIAANYYDKLLIINDRDYDIYNAYGLLFLYQNNYDLALDNFKKVIEFAPSYTISYKYALSNIADTYIAMGKDNEAIDVYMELIEVDPTMCLSYSRLAILYHKRGNKVMSDQLLQIAKDNMWEGNYGQLGLACYYSFIGDLENSSYYLQTAMQMGFSDIGWLKYDPYLVNIRETEEFWELIEEK
jgi:tetratricopeptide (TPR) repeat protein